jgi:hypothetical protein
MAAATTFRDTKKSQAYPTVGTAPVEANTLILKGTMVAVNAAGRAIPAVKGLSEKVFGVARYTVDNRTGSEAGGTAGAIDVDVDFGVFNFAVTGTACIPGQLVYAEDNQTVANASTGARGIAGAVCEVISATEVAVHISPAVGL